ncbi:NUDIX hydrolase [Streptomyces mashuensis]|uniref:NUDIX hydrolase n=1 Tax=Streptomyces mashuensis TaxID=33904 RepID=UPI001E467201|nr:NUDIX hydrolase [Streptomyces mashuensis]
MTSPAPFSHIKIRTGAIVFCGTDVALIRRDRPGSVHYTPPGGNVEPGEDLDTALRRELLEELALDTAQASEPELLWVVDQRVSRPGSTPPPRKIHLLYRLHISEDIRAALATEEHDELEDGTYSRPARSSGSTTARPPIHPSSRPSARPSRPSPAPTPPSATLRCQRSRMRTTPGADLTRVRRPSLEAALRRDTRPRCLPARTHRCHDDAVSRRGVSAGAGSRGRRRPRVPPVSAAGLDRIR